MKILRSAVLYRFCHSVRSFVSSFFRSLVNFYVKVLSSPFLITHIFVTFFVVGVLFYVHGKQLKSCRDGQLPLVRFCS